MEFRYRFNGQDFTVRLEPRPDGSYLARTGERELTVEVGRGQPGQLNLLVDGERVHAYTAAARTPQTGMRLRYVALVDRETCSFEVERVTRAAGARGAAGRAGGGALTAQMPGQVMEVFVSEGERVAEGQPLLLLEAMKMEMRVVAPAAGTVTRLLVQAGQAVERGQQLAEVEVVPPGEVQGLSGIKRSA